MAKTEIPGSEGKHIGIELFSDEAPDLESVVQFVGAMRGAKFGQVSANELHFRCPGEALYGNFTMNLASARGLELLHETMAPHAVAGVLEELQARMCPRQVGYIAIDDAYSPALIDYIVREVPRLMAGLGNHAAALIVPCIGETEKAHLVTYRPTFDREFRNAVGMVTA